MNPGIYGLTSQTALLPQPLLGRQTPFATVDYKTPSPLLIPGLQWWIDSSDSTTVTLDAGRVTTIRDKSGNDRHASNTASGSTQPDYIVGAQNGLNVMRFAAASSQVLTVTDSKRAFRFLHDGTRCYVVAVVSFSATNQRAFGTGGDQTTSTGVTFGAETSGTRLYVFMGRGVTPGVVNSSVTAYNAMLPLNTVAITEMLFDVTNPVASDRFAARVNGGASVRGNAVLGTPSVADSTYNMQIGTSGRAASYLTGDVCELLIYSLQPTADEQTAIRRYLAVKWGISAT